MKTLSILALCFSVGLFSPRGFAKDPNPKPDSLKFVCPSDKKDFVARLTQIESQVEAWTEANLKLALDQDLSYVFAPHLLPERTPMISFDLSCWMLIKDLKEKPSLENFNSWQSCLSRTDRGQLPIIKQMGSCLTQLSKSK